MSVSGSKYIKQAAIACVLAALLVVAGVRIRDFIQAQDISARHSSGEARWRAVSKEITSTTDVTAHGNTEKARKMAQELADSLQMIHESASDGRPAGLYTVHCELWETPLAGKCAFLVHVPGYRRSGSHAEKNLEKVAWITAQTVVALNKALPPETSLCVALMDRVDFGAVMGGPVGTQQPPVNNNDTAQLTYHFTNPGDPLEVPE